MKLTSSIFSLFLALLSLVCPVSVQATLESQVSWEKVPHLKPFKEILLTNDTLMSLLASLKSQSLFLSTDFSKDFNPNYSLNYNKLLSSNINSSFLPESSLNQQLEKKFITGTLLKLQFTSPHFENIESLRNTPDQFTQAFRDSYQISISQNVTRNLLGRSHFSKKKIMEKKLESTRYETIENIEKVLISTLTGYFDYRVSKTNYEIMKDIQGYYKKLKVQIQKKEKLQFAKPGEAPLFYMGKASFTRAFRESKDDYEASLQNMLTLFKVSKELEIPKIKLNPKKLVELNLEVETKNLRPYTLAKRQKSISLEELLQAQRNLMPNISLGYQKTHYAKFLNSPGFDSNGYFISLNYDLNLLNKMKKVEMKEQKILAHTKQVSATYSSLENEKKHLLNQLSTAKKNLKSSSSEVHHAKSLMVSYKKAFKQGRLDLENLIQSLQSYRSSHVNNEIQKKKYFLLYIQWLCFSDQLIPTSTDPKKGASL